MSAPPIKTRDLPCALTVRVMTAEPSSTCPPFSAIKFAISLFTANRPVTVARSAPIRTKSESDLLPRTKPKAVKTIVLPAPVSPVKTVNPSLNSIFDDSITPKLRMEISSNLVTADLPTPTLYW